MSVAWLRDLEEKVHEAGKRLRSLEAENRELRDRVAELESAAASPAAGEAADPAAAAWAEERDEVRQRVGELVTHLEELLTSAGGDSLAAGSDD